MRVPFVVYADCECFTENLNTYQPNLKQSYTKQYQKHTPSGFCYHINEFIRGTAQVRQIGDKVWGS